MLAFENSDIVPYFLGEQLGSLIIIIIIIMQLLSDYEVPEMIGSLYAVSCLKHTKPLG